MPTPSSRGSRAEGRLGYRRAAESALSFPLAFRTGYFVYRYFGIQRFLADLLADRVELLSVSRLLVERLGGFNNKRLRSVFGERITEITGEIIEQRREGVDGAFDALRRQYPDYVAALEAAEAFRARLNDVFKEFDVLLAPSAVGEAPRGLESTGDARFNALWTLAWTPSLTLPAGTGQNGLPLGIQLVGPHFADEALLDAAAWVEARLG